ncbi:MAG: BrxA family protein [bacterium]
MDSTYTTRLQKGGALLLEMRQLTKLWSDAPDVAEQLVAQNPLALPSRARAKDVIIRAFVPRFVRSDPPNLWKALSIFEAQSAGIEIIRPIHYLAAARAEPLIADFVREFLIPRQQRGILEITAAQAMGFIKESPVEKFGGLRWSGSVQIKVAQGLLAALRDFGILQGSVKKRLAPFYLPTTAFCFIAFVLHLRQPSGDRLLADPAWQLFFLSPALVERMFFEAHQERLLEYHAAGRVIRIEFPAQTMDEYAYALTQRPA